MPSGSIFFTTNVCPVLPCSLHPTIFVCISPPLYSSHSLVHKPTSQRKAKKMAAHGSLTGGPQMYLYLTRKSFLNQLPVRIILWRFNAKLQIPSSSSCCPVRRSSKPTLLPPNSSSNAMLPLAPLWHCFLFYVKQESNFLLTPLSSFLKKGDR